MLPVDMTALRVATPQYLREAVYYSGHAKARSAVGLLSE